MEDVHLQMFGDDFAAQHWEWQEERYTVMKHGTIVRPTMYLANLDIKTAFDEAKPKRVAKLLDGPQYTLMADFCPSS